VTVSIVIRTKNEEAFLPQTLEAIYTQQFSDFEVIVVDSGSTDSTLDIVREFGGITLIKIPPDQFTYGRALNIGIRESTQKILVFLSAHAIPAGPGWLSNLLRHFDDPRVAAVYGRQLPHQNAYPPVKVQYLSCYKAKPRVHISADDHFFSNANAAVKRSLWEQIPFDEEIPYAEDQLWAKKILALGYRIIYEPEAAVFHSHNESLRRVYERSREEERGFIAIDPERYQSLRSFCENWWRKVVRDAKFIVQNNEDKRWLLASPVYRFCDAFGKLRPHLPRALWAPFTKRARCVVERLTSERR